MPEKNFELPPPADPWTTQTRCSASASQTSPTLALSRTAKAQNEPKTPVPRNTRFPGTPTPIPYSQLPITNPQFWSSSETVASFTGLKALRKVERQRNKTEEGRTTAENAELAREEGRVIARVPSHSAFSAPSANSAVQNPNHDHCIDSTDAVRQTNSWGGEPQSSTPPNPRWPIPAPDSRLGSRDSGQSTFEVPVSALY